MKCLLNVQTAGCWREYQSEDLAFLFLIFFIYWAALDLSCSLLDICFIIQDLFLWHMVMIALQHVGS